MLIEQSEDEDKIPRMRDGGPDGGRTHDLLLAKQALYQLRLPAHSVSSDQFLLGGHKVAETI